MSRGDRIVWVDVTKALAILLVVFYHAAILGVPAGLVDPIWSEVNKVLESFRMPVFFFASGIFAHSIITRPWRRLWSSRLALLVWTFALWTILRFGYFLLVPMATRPWETDPVALMLTPIWPTTGLWFLHALAVFFVVAKLIRKVPVWVQLSAAGLLSALFFSILNAGNLSYTGMARYFFFFLAGLYLRDLTLSINRRPRPLCVVAALVLYPTVLYLCYRIDLLDIPGVMLLIASIAVVGGCLLGRALAASPLARILSYIGKNTLPIYVQHVILVAAAYTLLGAMSPDGLPTWLRLILPFFTTIVVTGVALWVAAAVRQIPVARNLLEVPGWFSGARRALQDAKR